MQKLLGLLLRVVQKYQLALFALVSYTCICCDPVFASILETLIFLCLQFVPG